MEAQTLTKGYILRSSDWYSLTHNRSQRNSEGKPHFKERNHFIFFKTTDMVVRDFMRECFYRGEMLNIERFRGVA